MGWKIFLYIICVMFVANYSFGQNLIVNPGAEMPLSNGWRIASGNWQQGPTASDQNPPYDGTHFFYAGQEADAELYQDVDISSYSSKIDAGQASFTYTGHMRSYEQGTNDQAREIVEYRNLLGVVIDSFYSAYSDTSGRWIITTDTRTAKKGARTIRIRLLSHRRNGTDNDGYHDGLSLTVSIIDPCKQNYTWTTWTNFTGTSATGTINLNGQPVKVTMSSNFSFTSTPSIFGYGTFSGFSGTIPNTTVPSTTWSVGSGGTTTMYFSQTVNNPVLLFASLGAPTIKVTLRLSKAYTTIYDGGGMTYINDTTIAGQEGYAILLFPGSFDSVTIYSTTPEHYTNITWGLNPPLFPVAIAGSSTGCDSVTLNATGGKSYVWSGGKHPNSAINTFDSSGTYILIATDTNGCNVTTSATVSIKSKSLSTIKQAICQGQSFLGYSKSGTYVDTLLAANGCNSIRTLKLTVNPSSSSTISQSICHGQSFLGYSKSGTYVDTLLAANGCDSIRKLVLTVSETQQPNLGLVTELCKGDSLVLFPGTFVTYLWQDGSTGKTYNVKNAGVYTVTVTDECGSKSDTITITENVCNVYFPKAFTPNGDGKNDVFKMLNPVGISNYHLLIYDRYGKLVFQTSDPLTGWNGKITAEPAPSGAYVWDCSFNKQGNADVVKMQGTFVLIR